MTGGLYVIVSASRRTDIPKFYSEWFMNRIRAGYCTVPNPFDSRQVVRVSLNPSDVDVIVFWTKDPTPFVVHLAEIEQRGFRFYFQFTVNGYPRFLEPGLPPLENLIATFIQLAQRISPDRVIWRYDPLVLSNATEASYHRQAFKNIAYALKGNTKRVIISLVDNYRGSDRRLKRLSRQGIVVGKCTPENPEVASLLRYMSEIAEECGMQIQSCAESYDLSPYGIRAGKCIDDGLIREVFGLQVTPLKDRSQRPECLCVRSTDIGVYGTCRHGCLYCYASSARRRDAKHDVTSPSLVGWYEAEERPQNGPQQGKLFEL